MILDFLRPLLEQQLLVDSFVLQHRWLFNIFSAIECTTFETAGKHLETVFTLVTASASDLSFDCVPFPGFHVQVQRVVSSSKEFQPPFDGKSV